MDSPETSPLWAGRMSLPTSAIFSAYVDSIGFDTVLAPYDIQVSRAHALMLNHVGIIDTSTLQDILSGLTQIDKEITSGAFEATLVETDEDVHTAIERRLTEIVGNSGKALHTGRSRNDLVQMSVRLFVRDAIDSIDARLVHAISTLCSVAEKNIDIAFPGKTHLQHAQPILISHWIMSHATRLSNDLSRIRDARARVNICVLGSGALAGSTLPLDGEFVAEQLGCDSVVPNSIFGVSTRDYIAEVLFVCAQIVTNLSCLGEDIVWMSSTECSYVTLGDDFSSGSSMMPQKKNPDIAELVRGKAALSIGALTAALAATKSQIFGYNHDLQVDKEALFPALKDCDLSLLALDAMMESATFNRVRCENALRDHPLLLATDIAEEMVNAGTPFRIAYKEVASAIRAALESDLSGSELVKALVENPEIGSAASSVFAGDDLLEAMKASIERRSNQSGTATNNVAEFIKELRTKIS